MPIRVCGVSQRRQFSVVSVQNFLMYSLSILADVMIHCTADAKLIDKDGEKVLHVEHIDGDINWKKHHMKIENLFPEKKASTFYSLLFY